MKIPALEFHDLLPFYLKGILHPNGLYQPHEPLDHPYCPLLEKDWLCLIHNCAIQDNILGVKLVLVKYLIGQNGRPDLSVVDPDPDPNIVYYKSDPKNGETTGLAIFNDQLFVASPPFAVVNNNNNAIFIDWSRYSTLNRQVESVQRARTYFDPLFSLLVRYAGFQLDTPRVLQAFDQGIRVV